MDTLALLQQPHFHLGSHVTQVRCCCFSPDGSTILSGSSDNTLKLWRTCNGLCNSTLSGILSCGPDSDFYTGELDKTRSVMNQLSLKLKESRDVLCLSQEEVLLFLQQLDIPKPIRDSFKKNQIAGKALKRVSDRILRELGMSDITQRKGLLHSICNVRVHGCIHVAPPVGACGDGIAAWWSADEVWKWLEEQGFSFPCLKGLTGRTLIHLSDDDITQFGLPIGPALELQEKCETLKQSFFSFVHRQRESFFFFVC